MMDACFFCSARFIRIVTEYPLFLSPFKIALSDMGEFDGYVRIRKTVTVFKYPIYGIK